MKLFLAIFILVLAVPREVLGGFYVYNETTRECDEVKKLPEKKGKELICPMFVCSSDGVPVHASDEHQVIEEHAKKAGLESDDIEKVKAKICEIGFNAWMNQMDDIIADAANAADFANVVSRGNTGGACISGSPEETKRVNELKQSIANDPYADLLDPTEINKIIDKICEKSVDDWIKGELADLLKVAAEEANSYKILPSPKRDDHIEEIVALIDNHEDYNDDNDCWVKGNHIFASNCNVFNGNPVVADRNLLELGNIYVFTDFETVSKMKAENPKRSCKTCMEKVYKTFKGKSENKVSEYDDEKDKIEKKMVQKLKPKSIVPKLLQFPKTIEDIARASALYQNSIDSFLAKASESDKAAYLKDLQCPNADELMERMEKKCGETEFELEEAKKHIETALKTIGLEGNDFAQSFSKLREEAITKDAGVSSCDKKINMKDLQVKNYIASMQNEDDEPETAATNLVYKAFDKVFAGDDRLDYYCNHPHANRFSSPGSHFEEEMLIASKPLGKSPEDGLTADIHSVYKTVLDEFSKNDKYSANNEMQIRKSNIVLFRSAMSFDPNLRMLLSDWDSFCGLRDSFQKDKASLTDKEKEDNPIKSKRLVRGKIEAERDSELDDEQAKRIINYAKNRCSKAYDQIIEVACYNGSDITHSRLFPEYHLEEAAKELHQDLGKTANDNPSNASDIHAEMVLLGGLTCEKDLDFTKSSSILNDPLRIELQTFSLSNFSREKLRDGLAKGKYCEDPDDSSTCNFHIPSYGAFTNVKGDDAADLCSDVEIKANREIMLADIYGTEPDSGALIDHVVKNINAYSESDPDFVQSLADKGHFDGHQRALDRVKRLNPGTSPVNRAIASTGGATGGTGFSSSFVGTTGGDKVNTNVDPLMEKKIRERVESESQAAKDRALENSGDDISSIADAWKKERDALMAKHEAELKALRDQLDKAKQNPASIPKTGDGSLDDLQKKIDELEKKKENLAEVDKEMQEIIKEKSAIDKKVAAGSVEKKKGELLADVSAGRAPSGLGAFSSASGATFADGISQVPRSDYQTGVGGYVYVQDNDLAADQLSKLGEEFSAGDVKKGDIELDFIKVGGVPKLVKINGFTSSYVEVDKLIELIDEKPDKLGFLKEYLEFSVNNKTGEYKVGESQTEVMIADIDDAMDPPARLNEMKLALDYSKFRESCLEQNENGAKEAILHIKNQDAGLANAMSCD